jgi:hypothetical protein
MVKACQGQSSWKVGGSEEEHFLLPIQEMGVKTVQYFLFVVFILSEVENTHGHVI